MTSLVNVVGALDTKRVTTVAATETTLLTDEKDVVVLGLVLSAAAAGTAEIKVVRDPDGSPVTTFIGRGLECATGQINQHEFVLPMKSNMDLKITTTVATDCTVLLSRGSSV